MSKRLALQTWLSVAALLVFVIYFATGSSDKTAAGAVSTENTAVFTGTYVDGMPLYRLPPIDVVEYRKSDVASRARQDARSRAGAV